MMCRYPEDANELRQLSLLLPNLGDKQAPQRSGTHRTALCIECGRNPTFPPLCPLASVARHALIACPCRPQTALGFLHHNALGTSACPALPLGPHVSPHTGLLEIHCPGSVTQPELLPVFWIRSLCGRISWILRSLILDSVRHV